MPSDARSAQVAAKAAVVAAVFAAGGAVLGADRGAHATIETQKRQIDEARRDAERRKRATVYGAFLSAANRFAVESDAAYARCKTRRRCEIPGPLESARFAFQTSINDVYIYGSDAAVAAEKRIAEPLPSSFTGVRGTLKLEPLDGAELNSAYKRFVAVMCREVTANPRRSC